MNYSEIINQVAKELNLEVSFVDKVYKAYWYSIRNTINKIPLNTDINEEEFSQLRTNFNIPSLGKLTCTFDSFLKLKERFKYIKALKNNDKN